VVGLDVIVTWAFPDKDIRTNNPCLALRSALRLLLKACAATTTSGFPVATGISPTVAAFAEATFATSLAINGTY
jgi:hypothetical protein